VVNRFAGIPLQFRIVNQIFDQMPESLATQILIGKKFAGKCIFTPKFQRIAKK
jgi:hypothetical protein